MVRNVAKALLCGAALIAFCLAPAAFAQEVEEAGATTADGEAIGSAEIVVTAQKRAERLQDVPLSVSAFGEASIEAQGITRLEDYASRAAGIHLSKESTQTTFSVRGIAASTNAGTSSAAAGIFIDDYPIFDTYFRVGSPDLRIFDVSRIEVLRGPQGTLYGSTSLSGSIRIITNKPDLDDFSAKFEGTFSTIDGGSESYAANAMVNIPLSTEKLGLRAVGYVRRDGGYIDNPTRGERNVNSQKVYGGRLYLRAQPADGIDLLASITYQHDQQDDNSATYYFPPAGRSTTDWNSRVAARVTSNLFVANLGASVEVGGGDLSVTGIYAKTKTTAISDNSGFASVIQRVFAVPVTNLSPSPLRLPSDSESKTAEIRYVSAPGNDITFIVGAFFNRRNRVLGQYSNQAAFLPFFGTAALYDISGNNSSTEMAAFGEATWSFADEWDLTVGMRGFKNIFEQKVDISGIINRLNAVPVSTHLLTDIRNSESSITPRYSLAWKPQRNLNIYATASKGYRFGLGNFRNSLTVNIPLTYKSDSLWNYELGVKATMWDGRVSWNSTVYYIDWKDVQLNFRDRNTGQTYTTNAGAAESYGVESEFNFRPNPAFELNAAISVGKAQLTRDAPGVQRRAASVRGPAIFDAFKGDPLPGSSELSLSGGVQYNFVGIGDGDAYVRLDDVYVGKAYIDFMKQGSLPIGDYNVLNLRVGYKTGRFEITGFANNILGSRGIINAAANADLQGTDAAYRVAPRSIGATVRASF